MQTVTLTVRIGTTCLRGTTCLFRQTRAKHSTFSSRCEAYFLSEPWLLQFTAQRLGTTAFSFQVDFSRGSPDTIEYRPSASHAVEMASQRSFKPTTHSLGVSSSLLVNLPLTHWLTASPPALLPVAGCDRVSVSCFKHTLLNTSLALM